MKNNQHTYTWKDLHYDEQLLFFLSDNDSRFFYFWRIMMDFIHTLTYLPCRKLKNIVKINWRSRSTWSICFGLIELIKEFFNLFHLWHTNTFFYSPHSDGWRTYGRRIMIIIKRLLLINILKKFQMIFSLLFTHTHAHVLTNVLCYILLSLLIFFLEAGCKITNNNDNNNKNKKEKYGK